MTENIFHFAFDFSPVIDDLIVIKDYEFSMTAYDAVDGYNTVIVMGNDNIING